VNNKTPYEAVIAEKVNQLPVPDMADAIWATIELELDAAAGTEGDQQIPSESLSANTMTTAAKLWLIIIAVAVIALLIILFTKNKNNSPADTINIPATIQEKRKKPEPDSVAHTINNIPGSGADVTFQPQQRTGDPLAPVISPVFNDSIFNEPLKNTRNDSPVLINNPPVIIKPDSSATILPPDKKPRGVKGIEDSDYKIISGKKDSLKN
jgi:hypothetical protein